MDVTFKRTGERRYGVFVERPDYPPVEMNPAPSYDHDLPHDFVHFVVEEELGLTLGVFGQLAAGGDAGTFRIRRTSSDTRATARARKKQKRRGERLAKEGFEEAEFSERAATICHQEWLKRGRGPERRAEAGRLEPFVRKVTSECSPSELASLSEPTIQRVCDRLDELGERWAQIQVGQSIRLRWSGNKGAVARTGT